MWYYLYLDINILAAKLLFLANSIINFYGILLLCNFEFCQFLLEV